MNEFRYIGTELDLFSAATVWKSYLRRHIAPYLGEHVLEVGAGLGSTTKLLCPAGKRTGTWVCLEPDTEMARSLAETIQRHELPECCQVVPGTLDQVSSDAMFDTILYVDVLEHIADDRAEMARAAAHLNPGGYLVVLAPAHDWLFSPFDRAIGHYRRYTRRTLRALAPSGSVPVRTIYLDSVGLLASLGNRLFLKRSLPGKAQIAFWDKVLVRGSRITDPLLCYSLGKSVLSVCQRPGLTQETRRESCRTARHRDVIRLEKKGR